MKLVIASNNAHKIAEIKQILSEYFDDIVSLSEAGITHETVEDGQTFYENSLKKAKEIAEISGAYAIADDSGLCVDALGGAPGVNSARFCGEHGNDKKNNLLLLEKLNGTQNRTAHYTCAITLVTPTGEIIAAQDYMYGKIGYNEMGDGGFGYDSLFIPEGSDKTLAMLTPDEKNSISHRGKALRKFVKLLAESEIKK